MRKAIALAVAAALAVTALALPVSADDDGDDDDRDAFRVTITNLTDGQLMTPFAVATHEPGFNLFEAGQAATNGLQQVAENGAVPVLVAELQGNGLVDDVGVAGGAPIAPGASVEVIVQASEEASRFSIAGMLICTNDGFGGINRARLPDDDDGATFFGLAYDAGTEINTEAYGDLVPPCDGNGQTGATNPALAENGVVHLHQGIQGGADLSAATHGWTGPVIRVTVTEIDDDSDEEFDD